MSTSLRRIASLHVSSKSKSSSSSTVTSKPPKSDTIAATISPIKNKRLLQNAESSDLNLSLNDCSCPICLEVLIEPVRMPCNHELCLPCFKAMTDKTNFLCPMCRMRISSWSRYAANTNNLVDTKRWEQIKKAFPVEIKNRIEGKTAQLLAQSIKNQAMTNTQYVSSNPLNKICSKPGEIRKEYQEYLKREEERLRIEKEKEEKLSIEFIQRVIVSRFFFYCFDYFFRLDEDGLI